MTDRDRKPSHTRLKSHAPRLSLDGIQARYHAGDIDIETAQRELVDLVMNRVAGWPPPVRDRLRARLLDSVERGTYFVSARRETA